MFSFCLVVSSLHCNCVLLGDLYMVGDVGCSAKGDLFRWILALLSSWFLVVYTGGIRTFLGYFIGGSSGVGLFILIDLFVYVVCVPYFLWVVSLIMTFCLVS